MPSKRHVPSPAAAHGPAAGVEPAVSPRRDDNTRPAAHTLLVRLWHEGDDGNAAQAVWRGTVSDLRGRQLGSFSSAAELAGILGEMAGLNVLLRVTCTEVSREPLKADAP